MRKRHLAGIKRLKVELSRLEGLAATNPFASTNSGAATNPFASTNSGADAKPVFTTNKECFHETLQLHQ